MSTPLRILTPGLAYHVYNRSAGQKIIFHNGNDYDRFLFKMREYQEKFPVDLLAYCLMPNHFHLLIRPMEVQFSAEPGGSRGPLESENAGSEKGSENALNFLHRLFTSYAKYYDYHHEEHSGCVFQSAYKAKLIHDDAYYRTAVAYIHDNPVRKQLVTKPEEWAWSSYPALTNSTPRVNPSGRPTPRVEIGDNLDHAEIYREFVAEREENAARVREWLWLT